MAVVVLTSAPGAPGVTTTALALALAWPRHVLLVDADRDPSQAILAGYLRGLDAGGRGLASVAQTHRAAGILDDELWMHTVPLQVSTEIERRFLPGFTQPQAVRLFDGVWRPLSIAFQALDPRGIDVLVDAGRIGSEGLAENLLLCTDLVIVLTRSTLRSLAALRLHLPTLQEQAATMPAPLPLGLGIVGPGNPYSTAEITQQFSIEVCLTLPFDTRAAGVLSAGNPEPRRFAQQSFLSRSRAAAKELAERVHGLRASKEAL